MPVKLPLSRQHVSVQSIPTTLACFLACRAYPCLRADYQLSIISPGLPFVLRVTRQSFTETYPSVSPVSATVTSQSYSVVHSLSNDSRLGPSSLILAGSVRYEVAATAGAAARRVVLVGSSNDSLTRFLACVRGWWGSPFR